MTAVVLGLTFGPISFSALTGMTKNAVACGEKDKDTSKDKGKTS